MAASAETTVEQKKNNAVASTLRAVANTTGDAHSIHHILINIWVMVYARFEKRRGNQ